MSEADNINFEEISTKVEMVKLGMRHSKEGHVISFAINPADTPQSLMTDPLGQRYVAVLVRVDGDDKPVASQTDEEGRKAIALAGALCNDEGFQGWLAETGQIAEMTEHSTTVWLRKRLGITSRKELKTDKDARQRLLSVRDEFIAFKRRQ